MYERLHNMQIFLEIASCMVMFPIMAEGDHLSDDTRSMARRL